MEIDEQMVRRIVTEKTRATFWIGAVTGLLVGAIAGYAIGVHTATDNVTVITSDKGIEQLGLWQDADPIPPWEWHRQKH